MARQVGVFKFKGTIGNLTGWQGRDGEYYVKTKSSLDKEKIDNNPNMAPQRKMRQYFSLAAAQAKQIRNSLEPFTSMHADDQIHHRLTQALQLPLIENHPDACPKTYDFSVAKEDLEGFSFDPKHSIFSMTTNREYKYSDADLGWMDLKLGEWTIAKSLIKKAGASHFRWTVIIAALAAKPLKAQRNKIIPSPWMPINSPQPWECPVDFGTYQTQDGAVVIALVAESATQISGEFYTTQTIRGMNIVQIIV